MLFAPTNPSDLLTASTWFRMDLGVNMMRVMRVALANVAGDSRPEIVVGGKESSGKAATIGYYSLTNASLPRLSNSWTYTSIRQVGWVMQMFVLDVEGDTDRDIVYTDREWIDVPTLTATRGVFGGWRARVVPPPRGPITPSVRRKPITSGSTS